MQTALWMIKDIPNDGFEVIRDGRHVGIRRCDELEDAVEAIVEHDLFQAWDHVVLGWGSHRCDLDLTTYRRELVGA